MNEKTSNGKVEVSPERLEWAVSPLMEQVVLVTTVDAEGEPHVAAKSRVSVVTYGPPTAVFFACNSSYATAQNVRATGQFAINVPGSDLVATSWVIGLDPSGRGVERFDNRGLTRIPGAALDPPLIAECRAHIECRLLETREFGDDLAVFGQVEAVSLDAHLAGDDKGRAYRELSPFFFLDMEWTAPLGAARSVERPVPGPRHDLTILVADDVRSAMAFYSRAFEWPISVESREYVQFDLPGGRGLAICSSDAFELHTGGRLRTRTDDALSGAQLYLRTYDPRRAAQRLLEAGARPLGELEPRAWGDECAYFADPEGNVIALARRTR